MPRVSALKARVFGTCRLRFRYQYVDKARARLRPADTAGSLVHRVLCDFFTKVPQAERNAKTLTRLFEEGWTALSAGYHRIPGVEVHHEASLHQLANFARYFDLGGRAGPASNMVKYLASEAACEAVDAAIQFHGGNGFDIDYDIITLWPLARLTRVAPVNNEMMLNYIGEHVLGLPKSY